MGQRTPLMTMIDRGRHYKRNWMLGRGEDNRLEPECWPQLNPRFTLDRSKSIFAGGSCFAANLTKRLAESGFAVLGAEDIDDRRRNRNTPPEIYQELIWAHTIFHRDDTVHESDIEPFLIEVSGGKWSDLWIRPKEDKPGTREEALQKRRELYTYLRGAMTADILVISLETTETFWDEISQSYVQFGPHLARRPDSARFSHERLTFAQCKDYVQKIADLLLDDDKRMLLTVSPIVQPLTFTPDDILVANWNNKSVLRAVAGEVADEDERIDYVPSFEIATMTRSPEVWQDDLIHVQPGFAARMMDYVMRAYAGMDEQTSLEREALIIVNLEQAGSLDEAGRLVEKLSDQAWEIDEPTFHAAAMRLSFLNGNLDTAARHAHRLDNHPSVLASYFDWSFDRARILEQTGSAAEAEQAWAGVWNASKDDPAKLLKVFRSLTTRKDEAGMQKIVEQVEKTLPNAPNLTLAVASTLLKAGHPERALAVAEAQLKSTPEHSGLLRRVAQIHAAKEDYSSSNEALDRLLMSEPADEWANHRKVLNEMARKQTPETLSALDRWIEADPEATTAYALRARLRWRDGQKDAARDDASMVLKQAPDDTKLVEQVAAIARTAVAA